MKAIRTVLARIRKADKMYNLINHGDKIVIGLSGGKDSVVLTYCLALYQKFSHANFVLQPVMLDLGFPGFDSKQMEEFCASLGLKLIVSDNREVFKILSIQKKDGNHLPCSICSRMKKAAINKIANEIGFNKVAFAHHADDAVETLFMNEIYGGRIATFSPKMHLEKADIEFIRPLINVRESEIIKLVKEEQLPVSPSHCPADKLTTREDIKLMLSSIYKKWPESKNSFLNMLTNYQHLDIWDDEIYLQVNQDGLTLKPVLNRKDQFIYSDIRHEVFQIEQGISYEDEFVFEEENESVPYLIYFKETPIGTIRYRKTNVGYKLERFAILKKFRNFGYGSQVINFISDYIAADFNPCIVYLNAQIHLKEYYAKLGFTPEGETFFEANIEHIKMFKKY